MSTTVTDFPSRKIEVPKVLLPLEYALGERTQTSLVFAFTVNRAIPFETFETNGESIKRLSDTQIQLQGGKTYKLRTTIATGMEGSSTWFQRLYGWFDVTSNNWIGIKGISSGSSGENWSRSANTEAIAYIYLEDTSIFEVRVSSVSGSNEDNVLFSGTNFAIETLQNLSI